MKLTIGESFSNILYVSMIPYLDTVGTLEEELLEPEDEILCGDSYRDQVETRLYIRARYLDPIAEELEQFSCVESASARNSRRNNPRGLSNYIDIVFKHSEDVPQDKLDEIYSYTIRLSDHKDVHPENGPTLPVPIVGMKPKNLRKAVMKLFKTKLSEVQSKITKYELEKYGKAKTKLKETN